MPSLKDIRKRIGSVKNTQKITRAMKLVAAARLRRAQDAIIAARPYANSLEHVIWELSAVAGEDAHPLFEQRKGDRAEILMYTSDRGLAGAFNAQIIRAVEHFVEDELEDYSDVSLRIVGRKGREYFSRRKANIRGTMPATRRECVLHQCASHMSMTTIAVRVGSMAVFSRCTCP